MRWWLMTDPPCIMSVDNASVKGMDFSELVIDDPALYMVQWTEGKGEIERQEIVDGSGDGDNNLNGLREGFYDISPYAPLFQQFLWRMQAKNLLLDQAKKVQIDLIKQLFESKRQLPFHYPIAAGDYWWNATDESMFGGTIPAIQNVTATANATAAALNKLINDINSHLSDVINTGISPVGNTLVGQLNSTINEINVNIVNSGDNAFNVIDAIFGEVNGVFGQVNAYIVNTGNSFVTYINDTVLGTYGVGPSNSVNLGLHSDAGGAPPGIGADISHTSLGFTYVGTVSSNPYRMSYVSFVAPGVFSSVAYVPPANIPPVATSNMLWIPIGSTVPVNVTPAEQAAIINGILARTNQLTLIKNQKIGEVNALTTVQAVIDYDVLAGWPVIPVPPGYKLEPPSNPMGGGVTIITEGGGGGGDFPEAPPDGKTYGRKAATVGDINSMAWSPAAASPIDGGNF